MSDKADATEHWITTRRTPVQVMLLCSCGWRHVESRRQNALARAAKLRAAEARHAAAVEERETARGKAPDRAASCAGGLT